MGLKWRRREGGGGGGGISLREVGSVWDSLGGGSWEKREKLLQDCTILLERKRKRREPLQKRGEQGVQGREAGSSDPYLPFEAFKAYTAGT